MHTCHKACIQRTRGCLQPMDDGKIQIDRTETQWKPPIINRTRIANESGRRCHSSVISSVHRNNYESVKFISTTRRVRGMLSTT